MKVSIIGNGRMGQTLIHMLSPYLANLIWGVRSKRYAEELIQTFQYDVQSATYEEALECDIVIPFMLYQDLIPWLKQHQNKLRGKILVDIHIPFNDTFDDLITDYTTSASEEIQKLLPELGWLGHLRICFLKYMEQRQQTYMMVILRGMMKQRR
jgi:predicted dinucleotide-binding enzyme